MRIILDKIKRENEYIALLSSIESKNESNAPIIVSGLCEGARSAFLASLVQDLKKRGPSLLIVHDEKSCQRLSDTLNMYGINAVTYLPRDFVIHSAVASHDFEHERIGTLISIVNKECDVVIATADAALQYTIPSEVLKKRIKNIEINKSYEIDEICNYLVSCGYSSVEMVDGVGQFSRRGGIIDLFSPGEKNPVRIEFFDTEIDRMAYFDVITQRFTDNIEICRISPVREVVATSTQKEELAEIIKLAAKKQNDQNAKDKLYEEAAILSSGRELSSIDKYISFIYPQKQCLLDYFTDESLTAILELTSVEERVKSSEWRDGESLVDALASGNLIPGYADFSCSYAIFRERILKSRTVIINSFITSVGNINTSGIFSFTTKQTTNCFDDFALLLEELYNFKEIGYKILVTCDTIQSSKNLVSMLTESGHPCFMYSGEGTLGEYDVTVITAASMVGFELPLSKFAIVSSSQGTHFSKSKKSSIVSAKKKNKNAGEKIFSYTDLSEGDLVVHEKYGIGRYLGTKSIVANGVRRDYVQLQYSGSDMLYLPCGQIDLLSKYIGAASDEENVKLSRMGGPEWVKAKTKVKTAAREMAKELIQLYAKRQRQQGYAFPEESDVEREFADDFEYDETRGQLDAIEDIFHDMEKIQPMDRLLCGDVGYGKTEVALRAAFKAVCDGKQVAILVPTTILALQHYETINSRMRGYAVNVEMLSRFKTAKQQQASIRKIARGEADIVVGTHRLLSKDIEFKDLGLVIIDEEQRFGVAQKEKLRQLAQNVDTLTLTATPIPRTLNMAMSGIRDMSVLEEAPSDRFPVQSYVAEYDHSIIIDAIRRELRRGGQVFYLCNQIERMPSVAAGILSKIPDARIAVANGQMDKEELSDIWNDMLKGETDILVCTTIIETGVDIPNANTLIIEDADRMGLSQLHQLRGRVGRSSRRAYAYFTYPQKRVLSEIATKRLEAIKDFTEFGAGFKIAMRDLQIRGAGNILGAEQHGHMECVGYELYMRILEDAILEEKGESVKKEAECTVDITIDAFIPENYINGSSHRLDAYKKISLIRNEADRTDVTDELLDRYGAMPQSVANLLNVSYLRATGSKAGLQKIEYRDRIITFKPESINIKAWSALAAK